MVESDVKQPPTESDVKQPPTESDVKQPTQTVQVQKEATKKLKYLDFVQVVALYITVYLSTIYEYAKENSGPLKPGVLAVESSVKAVIGPVYQKFHDVPFELLQFVDRKVDESINELDRRMPLLVKQALSQVLLAAQKAPEAAKEVVTEVQRDGLVDATKNIVGTIYVKYEPVAKDVYLKYEPVAEHYAVSAWRWLNQLPLFPQLAQIIVPTAAHWCEKYNETLIYGVEKGYTLSHYLPLVPIEKITKVFEGAEKASVTVTSSGVESHPVTTSVN